MQPRQRSWAHSVVLPPWLGEDQAPRGLPGSTLNLRCRKAHPMLERAAGRARGGTALTVVMTVVTTVVTTLRL